MSSGKKDKDTFKGKLSTLKKKAMSLTSKKEKTEEDEYSASDDVSYDNVWKNVIGCHAGKCGGALGKCWEGAGGGRLDSLEVSKKIDGSLTGIRMELETGIGRKCQWKSVREWCWMDWQVTV